MAKKYTGSLTLEWFNKNRSIITQKADQKRESDIPAPRINWINKDEALFYEISEEEGKGLTPYWVDRNDIRVKESRPLVFQKAFKAVPDGEGFKIVESDEDDSEIENMLIKGDNLLALNTLKKIFDQRPDDEKVKCIYIDPPYNTDNAFEDYDDALEHSDWLSMMRDRLRILKHLLQESGFIFVQIDEKEQAYLKVLMDEIFGRQNFINQIVVKTKPSAGASGGGEDKKLKKNIEYILFYSKNRNYDFSFSHEKEYSNLFGHINDMRENGKSWKYTSVLTGYGDCIDEYITQDGSGADIIIKKYNSVKRTTINQIIKNEGISEEEAYFNYYDTIFSDTNAQTSIRSRVIDTVGGSLKEDELLIVNYTPKSGKEKGKVVSHYYISKTVRRVIWLKDSAIRDEEKHEIVKANTLSTLWQNFNWNNVTKEGSVQFPNGKKPEALLEQIINLSTEESDIVLDCFAGSGTTFTTSIKLNRRSIAIEIGEHADTKIIPRLRDVIKGENQSEIDFDNWNGGGSFKYYHLGESIISLDSDGYGDFYWSLGRDFIEKSLLATYDFVLVEDFKLPGSTIENPPKVGFFTVNNYTMAGIVSLSSPDENAGALDNEYISELIASIRKEKSPQSITIFTNRGVEMAWESKPEDVEIIKVPHAIFAELER